MTDNFKSIQNISDNLNEYNNRAEDIKKDSMGDMLPFCEEITVMKTEIKEELYDCEMSVNDIEFVIVKDERTRLPEDVNEEENLGLITNTEHLSNENLVFGNGQLKAGNIQKNYNHSTEKKQHIHNHSSYKPFKCTYKSCKCKSEQKETCKCDTCGYASARKDNLKEHILMKHSEGPKKYKCGYCEYAVHTKQTLQRHIRTHTKPFKCTYKYCNCADGQEGCCQCDTCGYAAAEKRSLTEHILMKHQNEEPKKYKCRDCEYSTHRKGYLEQHIRTHADRPFKCTYKDCKCTAGEEEYCNCDMCGYAAVFEHNLANHILMKHSEEPKKYKCRNCKFATHKKDSLKLHIHTHTNDRPFKCTYKNCKCTAGQEESCKCDSCEYTAVQKHHLKYHILVKHSEEPKKYKCRECKYATHRKQNLEQHTLTHSDDGQFK